MPYATHYFNGLDTADQCAKFQTYVGPDQHSGTTQPLSLSQDGVVTYGQVAPGPNLILVPDRNHIPPVGFGLVNVLAAIARGGPGFSGAISPLPDLRNGRVVMKLRARKLRLPKPWKLVFWVQTQSPIHPVNPNYLPMVNIAYKRRTLCTDLGFGGGGLLDENMIDYVEHTNFIDVEIPFTPSDADWQQLGSRSDRQVQSADPAVTQESVYSACPADKALASWNGNMGILAVAPGRDQMTELIQGELHLESFYLDKYVP